MLPNWKSWKSFKIQYYKIAVLFFTCRMDDKLIVTLNVEELRRIIDESLAEAFKKLPVKPNEDTLMQRSEVAKLFNVSLVTLNQWRREGRIIRYKIKSRVYFKKSEIMNAIHVDGNKY